MKRRVPSGANSRVIHDSRFQQGHRKFGGREAGTPDQANQDFIIARLMADLGDKDELVAYLKFLAINRPASFCKLLENLLPRPRYQPKPDAQVLD